MAADTAMLTLDAADADVLLDAADAVLHGGRDMYRIAPSEPGTGQVDFNIHALNAVTGALREARSGPDPVTIQITLQQADAMKKVLLNCRKRADKAWAKAAGIARKKVDAAFALLLGSAPDPGEESE